MNKKQRSYAQQKYQEGLSRIRQRISLHSQNGFSPAQQSISRFRVQPEKGRVNGFLGKIQTLQKECEYLLQDINQLCAQKRNIETRLGSLRQDLIRKIQQDQSSRTYEVQQLSKIIKDEIAENTERRKRIQDSFYQNVQLNNSIKVDIVELRNKINEVEHRLGCNATIWHKI